MEEAATQPEEPQNNLTKRERKKLQRRNKRQRSNQGGQQSSSHVNDHGDPGNKRRKYAAADQNEPKIDEDYSTKNFPFFSVPEPGEVDSEPKVVLGEIDFLASEEPPPCCVCIWGFAKGPRVVEKELVRFIEEQFTVAYTNTPETLIVACSILGKEAFVQFMDPTHADSAASALDGANFQGVKLRVYKNQEVHWKRFRNERKLVNKARMENIELHGSPTGDLSSPQIEYFWTQIITTRCLYFYDFPKHLGREDLTNLIVEDCTRIMLSSDFIEKCHVRFSQKDACVQLQSTPLGLLNIVGYLNDRPPPKKQQEYKIEAWKPAHSQVFLKYYQEKEKAKRQAPEQQEEQNEKQINIPLGMATKVSDSSPSETNKESIAIEDELQKKLATRQEELDIYKKKCEEWSRRHKRVAEAKKRNEEEADTKQFVLKKQLEEEKESNLEQTKLIDELKKENKELKLQFNAMDNQLRKENKELKGMLNIAALAREEAEDAQTDLQARFVEMEAKNAALVKSLHQSQVDLISAREERNQAQHAVQQSRVQAHNKKDERLVLVKKELKESQKELIENKREKKRFKKSNRTLEQALKDIVECERDDANSTDQSLNPAVKTEPAIVKKETVKTE